MRWRLGTRSVGAVLLVGSVVVLLWQVHVGGAGAAGASCGSPFDVVVDRAGWETWYTQDRAAEPSGAEPLLRTLDCPGAVNRRTLVAGGLGAAGVVAFVVSGAGRRAPREVPRFRGANGLVRLGRFVTAGAAVLTLGGLAALVVVLADADATMFLYVERWAVALLGLVVLTPVIALGVIGRALVLVGRRLDTGAGGEPDDAAA